MTPKRLGITTMAPPPVSACSVSEESLAGLADIWSAPGQRLDWNCLFVLPAWLEVWWRWRARETTPLLRSVRSRDEIIGIAPLMVRRRTAFFMGDGDVCDYLDFVVTPGSEALFFTALVRDLRRQGIERLQLDAVRADSAVMRVFAGMAAALGCRFCAEQQDVAMALDLPATWEAYLKGLKGKERHEIRRKFRRLAEAGPVGVRIAAGRAETAAAIDGFIGLFKKNRTDKAAFMTPPMTAFFRRAAEALAQIGILKLFTVTIGAEPAAAVICFDYRLSRYLYNNAYDTRFGALSVGLLSKLVSLRDAVGAGMRVYDFLKGGEAYKRRLGARPLPIYRCRIDLNPRTSL
jgi:CelD/BcsL family acetyltransferase involved in cellulose biosynthesis